MRVAQGYAIWRWLVFSSALALAGLATAGWLVVRGAGASLRLAGERLGADIVVVPGGAAPGVEAALLVGGPVYATMPEDNVQRIASVAGVAAVWPQLYLYSPPQETPPAPALLIVACDPAREAVLRPWLSGPAPGSLTLGCAVGGARVTPARGEDALWLYGSPLRLVGNLPPTGSNLDRSLLVSLETAHHLARQSYVLASRPLDMPLTGISAALVRLRPASDPATVADEIERAVPGVSAVLRADLFAGTRRQASALGVRVLAGMAVAAVLSIVLSVYAAARAGRGLAAGVAVLAVRGVALGVALPGPAVYLLRDALVAALGLPMQLPSLAWLLMPSAASLACGHMATAAMRHATRVRPTPLPASGLPRAPEVHPGRRGRHTRRSRVPSRLQSGHASAGDEPSGHDWHQACYIHSHPDRTR